MASIGIPPFDTTEGYIMANVKGEIKGDILFLSIDLKAPLTVSKASLAKLGDKAPATLLASTGGFVQFGDVKVSVNAMKG